MNQAEFKAALADPKARRKLLRSSTGVSPMTIEIIGDQNTDCFWIEIDKREGNWKYVIREANPGIPCGAEVARLNPYYAARRGGEAFARELVTRLNHVPE